MTKKRKYHADEAQIIWSIILLLLVQLNPSEGNVHRKINYTIITQNEPTIEKWVRTIGVSGALSLIQKEIPNDTSLSHAYSHAVGKALVNLFPNSSFTELALRCPHSGDQTGCLHGVVISYVSEHQQKDSETTFRQKLIQLGTELAQLYRWSQPWLEVHGLHSVGHGFGEIRDTNELEDHFSLCDVIAQGRQSAKSICAEGVWMSFLFENPEGWPEFSKMVSSCNPEHPLYAICIASAFTGGVIAKGKADEDFATATHAHCKQKENGPIKRACYAAIGVAKGFLPQEHNEKSALDLCGKSRDSEKVAICMSGFWCRVKWIREDRLNCGLEISGHPHLLKACRNWRTIPVVEGWGYLLDKFIYQL